MNRGLETLHADDLVRRIPEDRPTPLRGPEDAGAVVQSPEPRLGGVGGQAQPRFTLPQLLVGALASQRVGEHLRDQLQPLHQRVRPVALRPRGIEAQGAEGRRASHRERDGQIRLDPEQAEVLTVEGGRLREILERRNRNAAAGQHFLLEPGEVLLSAHPPHGRQQILLGAVEVGERQGISDRIRPLPQRREIDAENLADATVRVFDPPVHLAGRQVDEPRREVGDQRLELETDLGAVRRRVRVLRHERSA